MLQVQDLQITVDHYQMLLSQAPTFERRLEALRNLEYFIEEKNRLELIERLRNEREMREEIAIKKEQNFKELLEMDKRSLRRSPAKPVNKYLKTWEDTQTNSQLE